MARRLMIWALVAIVLLAALPVLSLVLAVALSIALDVLDVALEPAPVAPTTA